MNLLLQRATLSTGETVDVRLRDGSIAEVGSLTTGPDDQVTDLAGYVLLPAPAEPHAHLDKALSADQAPNARGDLMGAIDAWMAYSPQLTVDDMAERAERCARMLLAHGATAIRTHVDVAEGCELRPTEALVLVRERLRDLMDIQIVALTSWPVTGAEGAASRARLRASMAMGANVVGGCPHLETDPRGSIDEFLEIAAEFSAGLDLHTDETLNPEMLSLETLTERVVATGFRGAVAASHCVSLGVQPPGTQRRVAEKCAAASVAVIALPQTNLYLQARGHSTAPPRGLTAITALRTAGVRLAAGADNVQDPFNLMGRADPLETAALMVMAAHLSPAEGYATVSSAAREVMGLAPVLIEPGSPAELVAIRAGSLREAVATASAERIVIHRGRIVARTRLVTDV